jgi:hypothetical protein
VFNGIVETEFFQVKPSGPVGALEEVGGKLRDEEAEGGREVEGLADFGVKLLEGYVFAVVGEDALVTISAAVWGICHEI